VLNINQNRINTILQEISNPSISEVKDILDKALSLQRLTLRESAVLLKTKDKEIVELIFQTARKVKQEIYGNRIVLFAPLYISNFCSNNCSYCAFRRDNIDLKRKFLSCDEIKQEVEWLLSKGHKRILMVAGEYPPTHSSLIDYYTKSIDAIYSARYKNHNIRRVNVNVAPLSVEEFKILKQSGIGTYQLFQETYHDATYIKMHPDGIKSNPDNRIDAIDRAFAGGIDDVGLGVLYGLYDYQFETLGLLAHVEHLEQRFNIGPHTISIPRIEEAYGIEFTKNPPYKVHDEDFKKIVAVLRLAVPYTGIILSTRETAEFRDELFNLGVSQVSADSKTSPGGYAKKEETYSKAQFSVHDERSLDDVIKSLIEHDTLPSFCTACYRRERTGEKFMELAKPGTIKGKCSLNALVTLREYLDDFASSEVKSIGEKVLQEQKQKLSKEEQRILDDVFVEMKNGVRDKSF
jgi:2-iminoacetate synthase